MRPSPLNGAPGAVRPDQPDDPDVLVPAHYGSPLREQNRLEAGRAVSALARDVVAVSGPDRLSWLTTLSSQVLTALTPGDGGAETLLMDAQGHITHALAAVDDGEILYLLTEAGHGAELARFLESMRFMLRVEVTEREDLAALGALSAGVDRLAQAAGQHEALRAVWRDPWPGVCEGGTSYDVGLGSPQRPFRHPGERYRAGAVIVEADRVTDVARAFAGLLAPAGAGASAPRLPQAPAPSALPEPGELTSVLAGSLAWEALRVEAGRPRFAREVDARTIPHELDWLRTAVHLTKGCYPGQETIARTVNLGRPPRRLTLLQLDGLSGDLPQPGARVLMGQRAVGTVTSVARHHDLGPIALALLRRGVPAEEPLTVEVTAPGQQAVSPGEPPAEPQVVGRVDAAQELLVTPEGKAQDSPAQRPGAGLRTSLLRPARADG